VKRGRFRKICAPEPFDPEVIVSIESLQSRHTVVRTPRLRVLFDEAHSQAWTIRPSLAAQMQPQHPADASYASAAAYLADHDIAVAALTEGHIDEHTLVDVDVFVIAHPSDSKWEATVGVGSPLYSADELTALDEFVSRGGGLLVLAETEQSKYATNITAYLAQHGLVVIDATVQDYTANRDGNPTWIKAQPSTSHSITRDVHDVTFYRTGIVTSTGDVQKDPGHFHAPTRRPVRCHHRRRGSHCGLRRLRPVWR